MTSIRVENGIYKPINVTGDTSKNIPIKNKREASKAALDPQKKLKVTKS